MMYRAGSSSFLLSLLVFFLDRGELIDLLRFGGPSSSSLSSSQSNNHAATSTTSKLLVAAQDVTHYYEFSGRMTLSGGSVSGTVPTSAIEQWETVTGQAFADYLDSVNVSPTIQGSDVSLRVTNGGAGMVFEFDCFTSYTSDASASHDPIFILSDTLSDNAWFSEYVGLLRQTGESTFASVSSLSMSFDASSKVTNTSPSWQSPDTTPATTVPVVPAATNPPTPSPVDVVTTPSPTAPPVADTTTTSPPGGDGDTTATVPPDTTTTLPPGDGDDSTPETTLPPIPTSSPNLRGPTQPPASSGSSSSAANNNAGGGNKKDKDGPDDKIIGIILISAIFGVLAAYCCCYQNMGGMACCSALFKKDDEENKDGINPAITKRTSSNGSLTDDRNAWIFNRKVQQNDDDDDADMSTLGYPFTVVNDDDAKTYADKTVSNASVIGTSRYKNLMKGIGEAGEGGTN